MKDEPLSLLTTLNRERWARSRQVRRVRSYTLFSYPSPHSHNHVRTQVLLETNEDAMEILDTSLFVLSLDSVGYTLQFHKYYEINTHTHTNRCHPVRPRLVLRERDGMLPLCDKHCVEMLVRIEIGNHVISTNSPCMSHQILLQHLCLSIHRTMLYRCFECLQTFIWTQLGLCRCQNIRFFLQSLVPESFLFEEIRSRFKEI